MSNSLFPISLLFLLCSFTVDVLADVDPFESHESLKYSYTEREKRIKIEVQLEKLDKKRIKEETNKDRKVTRVTYGDRELPKDMLFYNAPTLISSFKIWLDGKPVKFAKANWQDIPGFRLYSIKSNIDLKKSANQERFHDFASEQSSNPQAVISDNAKTILVTWSRREDGDVATIFRWIIDVKTGTALRHGEMPTGDF